MEPYGVPYGTSLARSYLNQTKALPGLNLWADLPSLLIIRNLTKSLAIFGQI
jgi:hypothetical protein